jgi:hemerythrin-like domain-containing protein
MTQALSSLIREHQVMSLLADALQGFADNLNQPGPKASNPNDLGSFARFFREFVDEIHHEKEEHILLPLLTRHGFCWEEGILAQLRQDHEQELSLIDILCHAAERYTVWSAEDRRSIAASARALAAFQREHLARENAQLFPEVMRRLPGDVLDRLQRQLARFDETPQRLELSADLVGVANRLVRRYASSVRRVRIHSVSNLAELSTGRA